MIGGGRGSSSDNNGSGEVQLNFIITLKTQLTADISHTAKLMGL